MNIDYDALRDDYVRGLNASDRDLIDSLRQAVEDGEVPEQDIRFVWAICEECEGDGGHSRRFGAYSQDEFDELDDEFRYEYLRGRYDESCERCNGSGKERVLDEDTLTPEGREWVEKYRTSAYKNAEASYYERLYGC